MPSRSQDCDRATALTVYAIVVTFAGRAVPPRSVRSALSFFRGESDPGDR